MYKWEHNTVFGQELESFSHKSSIIQSGITTMQTTFDLELDFGAQGTHETIIQVSPNYVDINGVAHAGQQYIVLVYDSAVIFELHI